MKTRSIPQHEEEDLFLKVFFLMLGLVIKLLRYLGRRAIQNPMVGLLYLTLAFPALFLIVQNLRLLWATATAPRFTQPAPIWPLAEPVQPLGVALLVLMIISVITVDRWAAYRARRCAAKQENTQAPPRIDEWVLGRAYNRTWNPDPGGFQLEETQEQYRLTEEHLRTNMIVVAPPGGGKTRSVLKPALHFFKRTGAAVICIDAKAKADGRDLDPKEFHLNFDLNDPQNSMRLNVWSGRTPDEMGERLAEALMPEPGEDKRYFSDNAKDALIALATAHHVVYGEMPSLKAVLAYLRDSRKREDLAEELRNGGLPDESEEIDGLLRINKLADMKSDPLGSLDTALAPLARGEVAQLLTTARDGYSIEQLLQQPVRVRFALPEGGRPRLTRIIGRLVLAQFTYAVISPDCNKRILKAAVVDEAESFVTPAIAKGMSMARENRGCYILTMQDLSQIEDPTLREDVLSVAGNKMVMAGVGDYDAKKFSALFGTRERPYTTHSRSTSQGKHSSQSRGSGHGGYGSLGSGDLLYGAGGARQQSTRGRSSSHQQSEGNSIQLRERAEFLTSEIRGLPPFHALIERRDNRGEVTPVTVVHLDIETIEDTAITQALRLYNETGSLEAATPQLPAIRGHQVPVDKGVLVLPEHHDRTGAREGSGTIRPIDSHVEVARPKSHPEMTTHTTSMQGPSQSAGDPSLNNNAATQTPNWVRPTANLVAQKLRIMAGEAEELTNQACCNGRDAMYVRDNLEYAAGAPNVENCAELFRFLIKSDQHRCLFPKAKAGTNTPRKESSEGLEGTETPGTQAHE